MKWQHFESLKSAPVTDDALKARLQFVASQIFLGFAGNGYCRCDIRMDGEGRLHVIDVNPNPGIFYPDGQFACADTILACDVNGHREFLQHIIACALRRRDKNRPKWEIRHHPLTDYGIVATVDIAAGEKIVIREERPLNLVSLEHVRKTWPAWRRKVFEQSGYPISENVFVTWDDNPERWYPTNHACDPNAVVDGLDFVARRDIGKGETITLDYATFCSEALGSFTCQCKSPACRGTVHGTDYREPWVIPRFGRNVSDFVWQYHQRNKV